MSLHHAKQMMRGFFLLLGIGNVFLFSAVAIIASPLQAPPNDDFNNATVIASTPFVDLVNTMDATPAVDDPMLTCAFGGAEQGGNTIWYEFVAPSQGILRADTFGTMDEETIIGVWTGTRGSLTNVACNQNASDTIINSFVSVAVTRNLTYYIEIASWTGVGVSPARLNVNSPNAGGNVVLHVNFTPPIYLPIILHK